MVRYVHTVVPGVVTVNGVLQYPHVTRFERSPFPVRQVGRVTSPAANHRSVRPHTAITVPRP
jgi:hypothetical protein